MNLILILFFSLAAFAGIECRRKRTIGYFRSKVEPYQKQVDSALAGYKKHNYKVFEHAVSMFRLSDKVKALPDNTTMDLWNVEQFQELTRCKFVYQILADPIKLSEALKLNGLAIALSQQQSNEIVNLTEPTLVSMIDTIEEINEEEKKAKYDWNHTNLVLDELYYDLKDIRVSPFIMTSGFIEYNTEAVWQFVGDERTPVQDDVKTAALILKKLMTQLPKVLPLGSREKIEKAAEFVHEYINRESSLKHELDNENTFCGGGVCEFNEVLVNPPEPYVAIKDTLPELLAIVEPLRVQLDQAISGYLQKKYTVFSQIASQFVFSHSLKNRLAKLPLNSTIADSDDAAQTFLELTTYKFLYPILINPHRFGDALKLNALTREVFKALPSNLNVIWKSDVSIDTRGMKQVKATISKIIQEEAKNDYNKTNIVLNELYGDIGFQNPETLLLTYEYLEQERQMVSDFCHEYAHPCRRIPMDGLNMKSHSVQSNNKELKKLYPIDSDKKVDDAALILVMIHSNRNAAAEFMAKPYNHALVSIECDVTKCSRKKLESELHVD